MFSLKDTLWGGADLAELLHPDAAAVSRPGMANRLYAANGGLRPRIRLVGAVY